MNMTLRDVAKAMKDPNNWDGDTYIGPSNTREAVKGLQEWLKRDKGLPGDLKALARPLVDNPLATVGGATAIAAAPFTGGASLLGLGALGLTGAGMGMVGDAVVNNTQNISDYFTGQDATDRKVVSQAPTSAAPANPLNIPAGMMMPPSVAGNDPVSPTPTGMTLAPPTGVIEALGPENTPAAPPQMPMPPGMDWSKVDALLSQIKPQAVDEEKLKQQKDSNLWAGVAEGLLGMSDGSIGQMILGAGAGAAKAKARNEALDKEERDRIELANQKMIADQADFEFKRARLTQQDSAAQMEAAYKNRVALYNYHDKLAKLSQPQILKSDKNSIVYSIVNPQTKQREMKVYNLANTDGLLGARRNARALGGDGDYVDLTSLKMATNADPVFGPFLVASAKSFESGTLESLASQMGVEEEFAAAGANATMDLTTQMAGKATAEQLMAARNKAQINFMAAILMGQYGQATSGQGTGESQE